MEQLEDNLGALDVDLPAEALARLDDVSRIDLGFPHELLAASVQERLFGDVTVEPHERRAGRDD